MRVLQNLSLLIGGGILLLFFYSCQLESSPATCTLTGSFSLSPDSCTVYTDQFGTMCPLDFSLPIVVSRQDENFLYFISQTMIFEVEVFAGNCSAAIQRRQDSREGNLYYTEILLQEEFLQCAAEETIYFTARYLCEEQL